MSENFPHLNFPIWEGPKSSYNFDLADTWSGFNLVNMDYHLSVVERHPKLVLKFVYLKDMDDMDPFYISGVDGGK